MGTTMASAGELNATVGSRAKAREEIQRCSGSQFDPEVVKVFLGLPDTLWSELRENIEAPFSVSRAT